MKCFLCQKSNFEEKYVSPTKRILKCKNDGLHLAQQTKKEKIYGNSYFSNSPNLSSHSYYLKKLATIQQATSKRFPRILDIGCGWGDFLEVLQKEKIPYLGIDINKEAIKICRGKRLHCVASTIQRLTEIRDKLKSNDQISRSKKVPITNVSKLKLFRKLGIGDWDLLGTLGNWKLGFDAITMFQVIEHLKDPFPVLKAAKKLLKKNGVLLITTPNNDSPLRKIFGAKWSVYNEPNHHVFYNRKTLEKVLRLAGYKNIQVKTDSLRFLSFKYVFNRLHQIGFPIFNFSFLTFNFPIPTDPLGDIESTAYTKDV